VLSDEDQVVAERAERARDRLAEVAGGAGDDDDAPVMTSHVRKRTLERWR
jgi:hypothetical protein